MRCPQCTRFYDNVNIFQPPVKTCLPCYARLPANRDLWLVLEDTQRAPSTRQTAWDELRSRASRSRYARKSKVGNKADQITQQIDIGDKVREIADAGGNRLLGLDLDPNKLEKCDGCHKPKDMEHLNECPGPGDVRPLLCPECLSAAQTGDLQAPCYLCQQRFPIVEIRIGNDNKWRCEPCNSRFENFQQTHRASP